MVTDQTSLEPSRSTSRYLIGGSSSPRWVILKRMAHQQYRLITRDDKLNASQLLTLALVLAEDRSIAVREAAAEIARAARYDHNVIARATQIGVTYFGQHRSDADDTAITALAILETAESTPARP